MTRRRIGAGVLLLAVFFGASLVLGATLDQAARIVALLALGIIGVLALGALTRS